MLIAGLELSLKAAFPLPSWKAEQADIGGTRGDLQNPRVGNNLLIIPWGKRGWRSKSIHRGEPQAEPTGAMLTIKAPQVRKSNFSMFLQGKTSAGAAAGG